MPPKYKPQSFLYIINNSTLLNKLIVAWRKMKETVGIFYLSISIVQENSKKNNGECF